jgi:TonB family protein
MRVQRTRSPPSAPHSPLTRRPLGRRSAWRQVSSVVLAAGAAVAYFGCTTSHGVPAQDGCPHMEVPVATYSPMPDYPPAADAPRMRAKVVLRGRVDPDGSVHELSVVSSPHNEFTRYAMDTVRHWTYRPGRCDGVPVSMWFETTVTFDPTK